MTPIMDWQPMVGIGSTLAMYCWACAKVVGDVDVDDG